MRRGQSLWVARLAVGALALMGGALWSGCGNDVPVRPSYKTDIAPLMEAHCVRCHGAGGTLNADPDMSPSFPFKGAPTNGYFTQLADPGAGKYGALHYTGTLTPYMKMFLVDIGMPPPPSDRLDNRDIDMLLDWCANPLP
jgi:hypothetical protein